MRFNPKIGDKIVCSNGEVAVCCTLDFLKSAIDFRVQTKKSILGYFEKSSEWQDWDEGGECEYYEYNIKEIIPAEVPAPCKNEEPDLEYKLKVLQKENEFLTRLLLKEGKL